MRKPYCNLYIYLAPSYRHKVTYVHIPTCIKKKKTKDVQLSFRYCVSHCHLFLPARRITTPTYTQNVRWRYREQNKKIRICCARLQQNKPIGLPRLKPTMPQENCYAKKTPSRQLFYTFLHKCKSAGRRFQGGANTAVLCVVEHSSRLTRMSSVEEFMTSCCGAVHIPISQPLYARSSFSFLFSFFLAVTLKAKGIRRSISRSSLVVGSFHGFQYPPYA